MSNLADHFAIAIVQGRMAAAAQGEFFLMSSEGEERKAFVEGVYDLAIALANEGERRLA